MSRNDLPNEEAVNFKARLRETVQTYLGLRGDKLDRGITLRDLTENGIASLPVGVSLSNLGAGSLPLIPNVSKTPDAYVVDLTPPPIPSGFMASAAISNLFIGCASQSYTVGHGHNRTLVYGAKYTTGVLPTFANAVKLTDFLGTIFSYATDPATEWHLWITWKSNDGVEGLPAGGTNGLTVTTGQDVAKLLQALSGQITSSQLYADLATRINLVDNALPGSVNARIATEATSRTDADSALTQSITTLFVSVGGNTSAISAEATARADVDGRLLAQYVVKVDVNGYVSGYGLASTAINSAPQSSFAVRADTFYIASPSGPGVAPTQPFIVRTTPTTINGVNVPAGVYMTDGYIQNGTITNAKIGNLAVDDAKIASLGVDKLIAGSIYVGAYIQSPNFASGQTGWRIRGDGVAEFSGVTVRGTITGSTINGSQINGSQINGTTINGSTITAGSFVSGDVNIVGDGSNNWGYVRSNSKTFADGANGWVFGRHPSNAQTVDMQVGSNRIWMASWNDCGIQFPGIRMTNGGLTIDQVDVVGTLQIRGNSVTVPASSNTWGSWPAVGLNLPAGGYIYSIASQNFLAQGGSDGSIFMHLRIVGGPYNFISFESGISVNGSQSTSLTVANNFGPLPAGWYTVYAEGSFPGSFALGAGNLMLLGAQR